MPKKYHAILQLDITDCAAACLATIAKQHGLKIPVTTIREAAGTDAQGTSAYGVVTAAKSIGMSAKAVEGDKEAFLSKFPLPCIAHVVVDGALLHYVVIHKITKDQVIIADPARGIVKLSHADFFGDEAPTTVSKSRKRQQPHYFWTGVLILVVPDVTFTKGDHTKGLVGRFVHLLLPQKKLILHVFIASIVYTVLGILGAFYFAFLIDEILPGNLTRTLHAVSIGVILLHIFMILLEAFRSHLLLYLSQKLDIALSLGYYRHILGLPMSFFSTRKVGEIISRFGDAGNIREAISGGALSIMVDSLMVVAGAFILFNQSAFLFGVSVVIAILYLLTVLAFKKPYRQLNQKAMEDEAQMTSYLVESLHGIQTIKAFNAEETTQFTTEKKFVTTLHNDFTLSWVENLQGVIISKIELIGGVVITWIGAIQVINDHMTIGQLVTFNALLAYFLSPVKNLIDLQTTMQTAVVASDRLGEILDLEIEQAHSANRLTPTDLRGDIEIKNLTFRYGTRHLALNKISLTAKAGEKIALVGGSGSGKTTLAKLILGLYPPTHGEILINSLNTKDIHHSVLREKIAYVSQETFLFADTIMANLRLGAPTAAPEAVIKAAQLANAHEFINDLPLRYETVLEENGANLSGGQRQRLAIARAILRQPDILILDEATSNLDTITEQAIEHTLASQTAGITTFIIAHRLSTIKSCDKIYVLEKGHLVEAGTHDSLLAAQGKYHQLVASQGF